ncbi:MAG: hypothetical protein FWD26_03900 [Treponema sp.]|nr:hypothetical protein [Treponema sp.]
MNDIGNLVKQYNRFIDDLRMMLDDINEILTDEFKMEWVYELWHPRERTAWPSKERFSKWYNKDKSIIYICIQLMDETPYLLIFYTNIDNKKKKLTEFGEHTPFESIEKNDIEKRKETNIITSLKEDWGDCYYCKIDLETINSNQVINTDLKNTIKNILNMEFNKISVTKIKFIES